MTKLPRMHRRTLLRGLGGTAIALPFLEIMLPKKAAAQQMPKRYAICFGGYSLVSDPDNSPDQTVPSRTGANYDLKAGLVE